MVISFNSLPYQRVYQRVCMCVCVYVCVWGGGGGVLVEYGQYSRN